MMTHHIGSVALLLIAAIVRYLGSEGPPAVQGRPAADGLWIGSAPYRTGDSSHEGSDFQRLSAAAYL